MYYFIIWGLVAVVLGLLIFLVLLNKRIKRVEFTLSADIQGQRDRIDRIAGDVEGTTPKLVYQVFEEVRKDIANVKGYISSERFIDRTVERIKGKQL